MTTDVLFGFVIGMLLVITAWNVVQAIRQYRASKRWRK